MYKKLIKADNPQIFFKHELGALIDDHSNCAHYKTQYFTFLDENDKFADKVLYVPYDVNDKYYWGDKICVMKRCVEEHYSQSIIDSCRKEHKKVSRSVPKIKKEVDNTNLPEWFDKNFEKDSGKLDELNDVLKEFE